MTEKQEKILAVLDMSEDEQIGFIYKHKGISAYCAALAVNKRWGDLAFRLSGGKIAGKKPIEYIIDALLAKESK